MKIKRILALALAVVLAVGCMMMSACGEKAKVVVAEAESAGEEVMNTDAYFKDMTKTPVEAQRTALLDVQSGTADYAVIDYVMSIGSIGDGTDFADLKIVENQSFAPEQYGIAFRKGSDTVNYVNKAISEMKKDGSLKKIAEKYKLEDLILDDEAYEEVKADDSDFEYIKKKGELVIGITYFEPMNFIDEKTKEDTGFEADFAKAVCEKLGVKAKFQEIKWETKETELASKNIDCIWNGMTITDERKENMQISTPYMQNKQVIVEKSK